MDALIVVDMQVGLLNGQPKHDLHGVIERINQLAAKVRERSGVVIFVQHCSGAEDDFVPDTPGWALLPELNRAAADIVIRKTLNDPFEDYLAYLRASHTLVERVYQLEKAHGFEGAGSAESRQFTAERLAAGVSELRDMIVTAWEKSAMPVPPYNPGPPIPRSTVPRTSTY